MKRTVFIANRIREVLLNGTWIANTNFKDQLNKISWQEAIQKVETLNSIAALTYHINYYLAGLMKAFENGALEISDKYSFDAPSINSEEDWKKLKENFLKNAEDFAKRIEQMPEETLEEPFFDPKYGNYERNLEAMIEHSYYHLGQISLIRKLIQKNE